MGGAGLPSLVLAASVTMANGSFFQAAILGLFFKNSFCAYGNINSASIFEKSLLPSLLQTCQNFVSAIYHFSQKQ